MFDAEVYAVNRAFSTLHERQESGRRYPIFSDSTAAIDKVRTDTLGPGKRFALAVPEVFSRIMARENELTVRWAPASSTAASDEKADEFSRAAANKSAPREEVPEEYR